MSSIRFLTAVASLSLSPCVVLAEASPFYRMNPGAHAEIASNSTAFSNRAGPYGNAIYPTAPVTISNCPNARCLTSVPSRDRTFVCPQCRRDQCQCRSGYCQCGCVPHACPQCGIPSSVPYGSQRIRTFQPAIFRQPNVNQPVLYHPPARTSVPAVRRPLRSNYYRPGWPFRD